MEKKHISIAKELIKNHPFLSDGKPDEKNFQSFSHLRWMLDNVISDEMSDTKASRWLGYVQAQMVLSHLTSYEKMLDIENVKPKLDRDKIVSHIEVIQYYLDPNIGIDRMPYFLRKKFETFNIKEILLKINKDKWDSCDANRILGIIQGILCDLEFIDVLEERERTRSIFNGE